ncbi:MAG: lysine--tRNA ligase [Nitrososphaerota archaeon]|nr:lysine--tRNA ligase [Nitrososphaerota archaeon]MDG6939813.1 lysine--tRNA ligase [Nitrososphaerota archaeon]
MDKVAHDVLVRERGLGRSLSMVRVESGLGASGIPHVGNLSDCVRAFGIKLALEVQGVRSEHIAFTDDMDGLRKVPAGLPDSVDLTKYIGHPVSRIPDPFSCHDSYGGHMGFLLLDAMDKLGVEYVHESATENYRRNRFARQVRAILARSEEIGAKIRELTGQEKYEEALPFFPICAECGRIYTTKAVSYDARTDGVGYRCEGAELRGRRLEGCGYEGEAKVTSGEGKMSWKVEFAARWSALDIRYEAYGKELADSVRINDWVSDEILGFPHPYHVKWELLLDRSGKKISKSEGGLVTPQTWFRYGTKESLVLLMFKRIVGARKVSIEEIPKYMDEFDWLEDVYHGKARVDSEGKLVKLKGLYEYVTYLKPPAAPSQHVPFRLLAELAGVAPKDAWQDYVVARLKAYRAISEPTPGLLLRIEMARNWATTAGGRPAPVKLTAEQRAAVDDLAGRLAAADSADYIQNQIFEVGRAHGMQPSEFFRLLYAILLGSEKGPRLGPYLYDMGVETAVKALSRKG